MKCSRVFMLVGCFLFLTLPLVGQNNNDFIVTQNRDTIYGNILNSSRNTLYDSIRFTSISNQCEVYTPNDISGFYSSRDGYFSSSSAIDGLDAKISVDSTFVQVLLSGSLGLYKIDKELILGNAVLSRTIANKMYIGEIDGELIVLYNSDKLNEFKNKQLDCSFNRKRYKFEDKQVVAFFNELASCLRMDVPSTRFLLAEKRGGDYLLDLGYNYGTFSSNIDALEGGDFMSRGNLELGVGYRFPHRTIISSLVFLSYTSFEDEVVITPNFRNFYLGFSRPNDIGRVELTASFVKLDYAIEYRNFLKGNELSFDIFAAVSYGFLVDRSADVYIDRQIIENDQVVGIEPVFSYDLLGRDLLIAIFKPESIVGAELGVGLRLENEKLFYPDLKLGFNYLAGVPNLSYAYKMLNVRLLFSF